MAAQLYKTTTGHMFHAGNIALVSVGLPARGKTYFANKLSRYLRWLGIPTKIFSVGDYRRQMIGTRLEHDFFNSSSTAQQRLDVANKALQDLIDWIQKDGGQVAIYDASNVEQSRRQLIHDRLVAERIQVLFVEAICDRDDIIQANIRQVKLSSPDYEGMDPDLAVADFLKRIEGYRPLYQPVSDPSYSYIKNINVGERIIVNKVNGYLPTRIVYYLMNLHIMPRRIYLCRVFAIYTIICLFSCHLCVCVRVCVCVC
jgi:6-phosphofructo-2-kinase/fructose-2,6-biphosphatase 4